MTLPNIPIPEYVPPTDEDLKRRKALAAEIAELREQSGPIDILADELKHQSRAETEG